MTDTTSMPVYKTSGDQKCAEDAGLTCSLTWCLLCFCSTHTPAAGAAESGRAADAVGKFHFETSRPSLLSTHIVLFTFHIMRTERDCPSTRKAGEHRRAFPGGGAGLGGGGAPNWLADTRSFRAACAPLRRAGSGVGIKRGPETEVGAYGEASRRLSEAAQALCLVGPLHGQFYRRAVSRGIISQDA
jgi:hypothetical protein